MRRDSEANVCERTIMPTSPKGENPTYCVNLKEWMLK